MNSSMLARLKRFPKWLLWGMAPMCITAAMATAVDFHSTSVRSTQAKPAPEKIQTPRSTGKPQR